MKKSAFPKKIILSGRQDQFWGPTGDEGPCGPTTEIYVDGVEIWLWFFNRPIGKKTEFEKSGKSRSGYRHEHGRRLAAVVQGVENVFGNRFVSAFAFPN